jgi:hypothetical protein
MMYSNCFVAKRLVALMPGNHYRNRRHVENKPCARIWLRSVSLQAIDPTPQIIPEFIPIHDDN